MLDWNTLIVFAAACLALTATPGPDMLLIASRSASQGQAAGFATLAGIQAGTYVHALAAAFGLSGLMLVMPLAYDVIRFAGAAYLLYLAWATWVSAGTPLAASTSATSQTLWAMFRQGFLTNILNPKMVLFVLALFPQFVAPERGSVVLQMLLLATVINAIGLAVNGVVIFAATRARAAVNVGGSRWPSYLLSAVFVGLAARLAYSSR